MWNVIIGTAVVLLYIPIVVTVNAVTERVDKLELQEANRSYDEEVKAIRPRLEYLIDLYEEHGGTEAFQIRGKRIALYTEIILRNSPWLTYSEDEFKNQVLLPLLLTEGDD